MVANRNKLQNELHKAYDRVLFAKEVLKPVFNSGLTLNSNLVAAPILPTMSETCYIDKVWIYGNIQLEDGTEITCYEILLQPRVRIEQSKVAIQQYVRKLLTSGQAALINFVAPSYNNVWRLTLVAKDSVLTDSGIKEKATNPKRYTFLLGPSETCKTAAERFEILSTQREISFQSLIDAFSVEKLSKAFFDEYTLHYANFCDYLQNSNFRKSVFKISIPPDSTKAEIDKACKPIRDFVKKMLGRIVFLYFVQKKGWLGASDTTYKDGPGDFIKKLFKESGGNDAFYNNWLSVLFFETLNSEDGKRKDGDFEMPDGKIVKVPFLNGGLFDRDEFDNHILVLKSHLFHNSDFEDTILTEKNRGLARGFLDFLDAFNFTVYEDSPDDHTVAVDPEMLGHIFENLLEDNKDKGAFYTPKEIVHYMCQESLTEYLCTTLQIKDEVAEKDAVTKLLKNKVIDDIIRLEITALEKALDNVKICDPAIGSGAFPMGLLQEIFSVKELIAYETGNEWKPAETKLNIIQNSIYGVDIEKGAVDIARLRFWLSLVVDEEKPRALPNLDYKIVVGDSLISKFEGEIVEIEWKRKSSVGKADKYVKNVQRLLIEVAEKQKKYFNPTNKNKKKLQLEIRELKIELLINQLSFNKELFIDKTPPKGGFMPTSDDIKHNTERELQIVGFNNLIAKLNNLLKHPEASFIHFDWKLDFPEVLNPYLIDGEGGFEIVIGNPPYKILTKNNTNLKELEYYIGKYKSIRGSYSKNLFTLFIEKAFSIQSKKSTLSFIVPEGLFKTRSYAGCVEEFEKNGFVRTLVTFTDYVFEHAVTGNLIFVFSKNEKGETKKYHFNESFELNEILQKDISLLKKIEFGSKQLKEVATVFKGMVVKDRDLVISEKSVDKNDIFLLGKNMSKWEIHPKFYTNYYDLEIIGGTKKLDKHNRTPRILIRRTGSNLCCAFLTKKALTESTIYSCWSTSKDFSDKYLIGLLNSKVLNYYNNELFVTNQQGFPQILMTDLEMLPIKKAKDERPFMIIVDFIIQLKEYRRDSSFFERLLDTMVYELYLPEIIEAGGADVLKYLSDLTELTDGAGENNLHTIEDAYKKLSDPNHPISAALLKLLNIEEVNIIEEEK